MSTMAIGQRKQELLTYIFATKNNEGTGVVPVIPNYTEYDLGIYAIQKWQHKQWNAEVGVRFDNQETKGFGI